VAADVDLDAIFAFHYRRVVANDHTIRIGGLALQLVALPGGAGYAGRRVDVQVRLDGRIVVVDGGRTLLATEPVLDAARLRSLEAAPANLSRRDLVTIGTDVPGYPPPPEHPWRRLTPGSKLEGTRRQEQRLTDSRTR
jgi:hypothetical protein